MEGVNGVLYYTYQAVFTESLLADPTLSTDSGRKYERNKQIIFLKNLINITSEEWLL